MTIQRRSTLRQLATATLGLLGLRSPGVSLAAPNPACTEALLPPGDDVPLYSSVTSAGNLLFIFGIGAHFEGDVKAHTEHVLNELEKELVRAGSSMQKVLKVSVLLHDPNDYAAMNAVYRGRFGPNPPVRTTVAVRGGIPNSSLVEIDCIAHR